MSTMSTKLPMTPEEQKEEEDRFKADGTKGFFHTGLWDQLDACVGFVANPDASVITILAWIFGAIFCAINFGIAYGVTRLIPNPAGDWHEAFSKNLIGWASLVTFLGFDNLFYIPNASMGTWNKWILGSTKVPGLAMFGYRRNVLNRIVNVSFVASRVWLMASPVPSLACGAFFWAMTVVLYLVDHTSLIQSYGCLYLAWSPFIFAKFAGIPGAICLLQFALICMYVGCGMGKMGPWFTQVFNQEWTLPPWAKFCDLRPYLYNKNFPRDNTPSLFASIFGYTAASTEWIFPLLLLVPAGVVGGLDLHGVVLTPAIAGIIGILAMHFYVVGHMPIADVWLLNMLPAYLAYYAFCISPMEVGFDYSGWAVLPWYLKAWSAGLVVVCVVGQLRPDLVHYMNCYRFWAGNWPQGYFFLTKSGLDKVENRLPELRGLGSPAILPVLPDSQMFALKLAGTLQTSQLPHRVMPSLFSKILKDKSLTDFCYEEGGRMGQMFLLEFFVTGTSSNDIINSRTAFEQVQKRCEFDVGELVYCTSTSFPLMAHLWGGRSYWKIYDAKAGLLEEGSLSVEEALAITRPSVWAQKSPLLTTSSSEVGA